jgi:predicted TIM-barrel fold metal-dependent hydrolase
MAEINGNEKENPKQKVEQNDPYGDILKSHKPDLLCTDMHQISIYRPCVIIDSHMHIQSGNCAPMPFLWERLSALKYLKPPRWFIQGAGEFVGTILDYVLLKPFIGWGKKALGGKPKPDGGYYIKNSFRMAIPIAEQTTLEIGNEFIKKKRNPVYEEFKSSDQYKDLSNLVHSCVVMTMDLEYAHVDGYYGIKVYNAIYADSDFTQKPIHYWYPAHGIWKRRADSYVRLDASGQPSDLKEQFTEEEHKWLKEHGIPGRYFDIKKNDFMPMRIMAAPCLTNETETDTYEQWKEQVDFTEQLVLANPLKLLPMFHYDPRRWQLNRNGNQDVYNHVGKNGLYLGFKIYTAQGYRPWDIRRIPILKDFYAYCCNNETPIMNHCTPEGGYTFDRDEYLDFVHPNDNDEDQKLKDDINNKYDELMTRYNPMGADIVVDNSSERKEAYFNDNFIAPDAWKLVLDDTVDDTPLNTLRLCLAHFGGNTSEGKKWGKQIIDMIQQYPNLYADISSSFGNESFRKYFMEILKKENEEEKLQQEDKMKHMGKEKEKRKQTGEENITDKEEDNKNEKKQKVWLKDRILFGTDWYMTLLSGVDYVKYYQDAKKAFDEVDTSLWFRFTQYNPCRFYRLDEDTQLKRIADNIIARRNTDEIKIVLPELTDNIIKKMYMEAAYIKQSCVPYDCYKETP